MSNVRRVAATPEDGDWFPRGAKKCRSACCISKTSVILPDRQQNPRAASQWRRKVCFLRSAYRDAYCQPFEARLCRNEPTMPACFSKP